MIGCAARVVCEIYAEARVRLQVVPEYCERKGCQSDLTSAGSWNSKCDATKGYERPCLFAYVTCCDMHNTKVDWRHSMTMILIHQKNIESIRRERASETRLFIEASVPEHGADLSPCCCISLGKSSQISAIVCLMEEGKSRIRQRMTSNRSCRAVSRQQHYLRKRSLGLASALPHPRARRRSEHVHKRCSVS